MSDSTPPVEMREKDWRIVCDILRAHVRGHEVWAFGSRAKWRAKPWSDLDLAIISEEPMSLDLQADLREAFSESDLPFKVDIVDWARTQAGFREVIAEGRVVVQVGG